jgi:hypothetical protein
MVVSLTHRLRPTPRKIFWYSYSRAMVRMEKLGKWKKLIHLIGARIRDLPACTLVVQPPRYRVPQECIYYGNKPSSWYMYCSLDHILSIVYLLLQISNISWILLFHRALIKTNLFQTAGKGICMQSMLLESNNTIRNV